MHASTCPQTNSPRTPRFTAQVPPIRRQPVDWSDDQKREFVIVATRCREEHAAAFCTVAVVLKTSAYINAREAELEQPPRGSGVAL